MFCIGPLVNVKEYVYVMHSNIEKYPNLKIQLNRLRQGLRRQFEDSHARQTKERSRVLS